MTSASPEFRHCLSSSFFLFSRDALTRSYRPEDFGHKPFAESGIDAATAERMRHQTGIELEVSDKRYDRELLAAVGSRCYLGPEFRELAGAIAPVMEADALRTERRAACRMVTGQAEGGYGLGSAAEGNRLDASLSLRLKQDRIQGELVRSHQAEALRA